MRSCITGMRACAIIEGIHPRRSASFEERIPPMKTRLPIWLLPALVLVGLSPATAFADWPLNGVGVGTATNNQTAPRAIPDGSGGAIIVWEDARTGSRAIYAQRIDAYGVAQWTANGVAVSTPANDLTPQLISDGAGGAIIAWQRNLDIYAQHVGPTGSLLWTAGGVVVCAAANGQFSPAITSDNAGGAIIAWMDLRNLPSFSDIFVRRVNSAGVPQWTADGVGITIGAPNDQFEPQLVPDGAGGTIIAWSDSRTGTSDIYSQRLNSSGSALWTVGGVALCTQIDIQSDPCIVADAAGGAIVAWKDLRTGANYDIYAQRVSSTGSIQWAADGTAVFAGAGTQLNPVMVADPAGGAFVAWDNGPAGSVIGAQRLSGVLGSQLWGALGVTLTSPGTDPDIVTDGLGGVIVAWRDLRTGGSDIYARRINSAGTLQWNAGGNVVCSAANVQDSPTMVSDGVGGAIIAFEDQRASAGTNDIYAQRIERNGYWGYPSPNVARVRDVPGDQGGQVNVSWDASRLDPWPEELIEKYTVWRSLSPSAVAAAVAAGSELWRDRTGPVPVGKEGVIRVQEINQTTYYWQLIHTVNAGRITGYSDIVPTPFDSTASSSQSIYFQVIAHYGLLQWPSSPGSGRSIDNLAPLPPLQLTAQRVGPDVHLIWNKSLELDLDHYAVYRKTTTGVTPIPGDFLSTADDTVLT